MKTKAKQPLRVTHQEFAEFYAVLCDALFREDMGLEDGDGHLHTSATVRHRASAVTERLVNEGFLEYR